ncbi:hypothetical protein P8452_23185 [Trifolium repens]|nr:defensin protein [Trifolium repens]WJX35151.1 hypothetical protein P8452_23181 [Trifolium repens]WJX35155.1 hypothetical protein P8452_23185 [Trifolium repens]
MMNKAHFGLFFTLFILLASQLMVQTEGRRHGSRSSRFEGVCLSNHRCTSVCRDEGFECGECKRFRKGCFCYNHC